MFCPDLPSRISLASSLLLSFAVFYLWEGREPREGYSGLFPEIEANAETPPAPPLPMRVRENASLASLPSRAAPQVPETPSHSTP